MWILTKHGFFSTVCARQGDGGHSQLVDPERMMVRARVRSHLETLKQRFADLFADCEIQASAGTDYAFRLFMPKTAWVQILAALADEIDYDNFKSEVARHQGPAGVHYGRSQVVAIIHVSDTNIQNHGDGEVSNCIFAPGPIPATVRARDGKVLTAPAAWILLPPGDAALTRRVKTAGDHWVVQEKKGRKIFSRGVWAPAATINRIQAELKAERSTESFAKRKEADAKRREKTQEIYADDFTGAVVTFLAFHPAHACLATYRKRWIISAR